ncbi:MAG TPA: hypothetical protein DDZ83_04755 [Nitrospinae bacterium]|nr:hypothetical protein [Nitrospinota bacterium]
MESTITQWRWTTNSESENAEQGAQITELSLFHNRDFDNPNAQLFLERLPAGLNVSDHGIVAPGIAIIAFDNVSARDVCAAAEINSAGAVILVECAPPEELQPPDCPVLLVSGRQSSQITHEQQVAAFERLSHGRIVELESCGDDPIAEQPEQLAETVRWFLSTL